MTVTKPTSERTLARANGAHTASRPSSGSRLPWGQRQSWAASAAQGWWFPLGVFLLTRAVDAVFLLVAGHHQVALGGGDPAYHLSFPTPADPSSSAGLCPARTRRAAI